MTLNPDWMEENGRARREERVRCEGVSRQQGCLTPSPEAIYACPENSKDIWLARPTSSDWRVAASEAADVDWS